MKALVGVFLFLWSFGVSTSPILSQDNSVLPAQGNGEEKRLEAEVKRFLFWFKKSDPELIALWASGRGTAPPLAEAARLRAMFLAVECDVALAEEFLNLARDLDPKNPFVLQARRELREFLLKHSQDLQKVGLNKEIVFRTLVSSRERLTGEQMLTLAALMDEVRAAYWESYRCDQSNVSALVGYQRMTEYRYGKNLPPEKLSQSAVPP